MPLFEYDCIQHGRFERLVSSQDTSVPMCPTCGFVGRRVISLSAPVHVKFPERMQYGSGSPGRMVTSKETGGLDIFIPSGGAMDKSEIDDVACAAIEKEQGRVKRLKGHARSANAEAISALTNLAHNTPKGQRIKVLNEAITESGIGNKIKVA